MIYIVRGNDFNIKVALAKKVDDTTVPYELTNVTRLRLALVGHGMHVFAEDVEVSPLSSNTVVGMIPGRALLLGTYGLEITFRDNGKDKRFFVDNMFEAVNELIDDSDDEAEGEGGGIEVTITIQPEDIDFAGETGTAAGFGDVTATIDSGIGTPSVEVTASGPDTAKNFAFSFHNLKGVKGDKGDKGNTGATGAAGAAGKSAYQVWLDEGNEGSEQDFLDSLVGPQGPKGETGATGATGPQGAKGDQGDPGSSVDYPFTLANNLTETDSTKALAAPQGKVLDEKISELSSKFPEVREDGYYVADSDNRVGMKYTEDGLDAAKITGHFRSLIIPFIVETIEDGFFVIDESLRIGFAVTSTGVKPNMTLNYEFINE